MTTTAYIGLGSNMESPKQHIDTAIKALDKIPSTHTVTVSSLYKSKPLGPQNQNDYINAVAELETTLEPLVLLDHLQAIENQQGRVRKERWGPRTLDLDILMFGHETIQNDRLTIPHAEMINRSFVLVPLAEINPDCFIPTSGEIQKLLTCVDLTELERLP